ncbi:MAG: isoprenylcysteine carboxylmethyltransferase family protein [Peptostreptococcaceae bacterium]|nr:isoprenylcysteine carboxylmethyltransferase family protein [Peptostreptococcaceae bacterium]
MSGFWLLLLFLIVRFGLLSIMNRDAIRRAGYFAPIQKNEKVAYYIYQISNIALFISLIVSSVKIDFSLQFYLGLALFIVGILLCAISVVCFAFPNDEGLNVNGIYKFSRNPMYVAYFVCFLGMSLLTRSLIMLVIVLIFQISAHRIIVSEERWCLEKFGKSYEDYIKTVRRYI